MTEDLEERILSFAIFDHAAGIQLLKDIRPEHFWDSKHRKILQTIKEAPHNGSGDEFLLSLTDYMREKGNLDEIGGATYLTHLVGLSADFSGFENDLFLLKERNQTPEGKVIKWIESHKNFDGNVKDILNELVKLAPLTYDRYREEVAKAGKIRVKTIDEEFKKRKGVKKESARAMLFKDYEPWEEPINGAELLEEIRNMILKYVCIPEKAADAIATWSVCTWLREEVDFAPILNLRSPTKRSGKTLLLDILKTIVYRPFLTVGNLVSPPVIFRATEEYQPTFLFDEAEKLSSDKELKDVIALINSGYRKGAAVPRCVGDKHEIQCFDTFGFKAVAAIGPAFDTISDRSIIIQMVRKATTKKIDRYSARTGEKEGEILSRKICRWTQDNKHKIVDTLDTTPRPPWLDDRACDSLSPLFAVGEVAGCGWVSRLLKAAEFLKPGDDEETGKGELIIRDIQRVFKDEGNPEHIESQRLTDLLNELEESPWGDYSKGNGISKIRLSHMLKPFEIRPKQFWDQNQGKTRGYHLESFKETFSRYLPTINSVDSVELNKNKDLNDFQLGRNDPKSKSTRYENSSTN